MKTLITLRDKQLDVHLLMHIYLEPPKIRLILLQALRSRVTECRTNFRLYAANILHRAIKFSGGIGKSRCELLPPQHTIKPDLHLLISKTKHVFELIITDNDEPVFEGPLFKYTRNIPLNFRRKPPKVIPERAKFYQHAPPPNAYRGFRKACARIVKYIENSRDYENRTISRTERNLVNRGEITRTMLYRIDKQDRFNLDKILDHLVFSKRILIRMSNGKEIYRPNPEYTPLAPPDSLR